ncbi:MAG: hypothetical protein J2P58_05400, partial [Acidimicrobiaceae bacterium]|nr:hypothetical protein [Acidimicrobiaceae bacterium]
PPPETDSAESEEATPAAEPEAPPPRGRRRRGSQGAGVDDLFSRLRAGREVAVTQARTVLEVTQTRATLEEPAGGATAAADAPNGTAESAIGTADDPTGATEAEAEPKASRRRTDLDLEPARSDAEEAWLQRRDDALGRVEQALTRRLKRAMQDEQNDLLDRLRSLRAQPTPDTLLPPLDEQQERFSRTAAGLVDQGAQAGVAFALSVLSERGRETAPPGTPPGVDEVDEQLAAEIVTPLRHRLEETINENGGDDDQAVLVDALGAAYREWKTQRLERIAGDALADAFSRGVLHATPPSVAVQWVVDDVDGPCSDCDDNVLAGALPHEEAFPTGQLHPPAHAGCRCILVPSV